MANPLSVSESRTYPVLVQDAFDRLLLLPLEQLFSRRFGPIPPVRGTDQDGVWGTVGQQRTVRLADGGTMREELTVVDRPHHFDYGLSAITGPMKPLVGRVDGRWAVEPAGTGCRITWSWTVYPANGAATLGMPILGRLWHGYARLALGQLETVLVD